MNILNQFFTMKDLENIAFMAVGLLFVWLLKVVSDWYVKGKHDFDSNHAIEEDSNIGAGVRRGGIYLAMFIAMTAPLSGPGNGFLTDLVAVGLDGAIALVLIMGALWVSDNFLLRGICNTSAIKKGNVAVGLIDAGAAIATGLIARGALTGTGGVETTIVFFLLGQVALVICFKLYELITPFDDNKEISEGNASCGLLFAGIMIALGFILSATVAGDFSSWNQDLMEFAIDATKGIVGLIVLSYLIDRLFLPNTDITTEVERDKNSAAIALVIAVKIGFALMISAAII